MKLASSFVSLLCVCALALAACGSSGSSSSSDELASLAPPDTPVYFEFTTQPSDQQKTTLESLISRFAPSSGGSDFDRMVQDLLDQEAAKDTGGLKVSYADDIQSWLGASGAFWIPAVPQDYDTQPDSENTPAAFVVQSTDDDAAQAFIDKAIQASGSDAVKKEIDGVQAEVDPTSPGAVGIDDGYLIVASTEDAFSAAVDARNGDSLADQNNFSSSFEQPSADTFASAYIDLKPFIEKNSQVDPSQLDAVEKIYPGILDTPLTASLSASSDSISLDVAAAAPPGSPSNQPGQLDDVPGSAVAALALGDLGQSLSQGLDQLKEVADASGQPGFDPDQIDQQLQAQAGFSLSDIEATLGTADVYVAGNFPDNYVVGIQIGLKKDASALTEKLKGAIELAAHGSGAKVGPSLTGSDGFSLQLPPQTDPASARVFDFAFAPDKATILISPDKQALTDAASSGSLTDSDGFKSASEALGSDYSPVLFTDLKSIGDAIAASGTAVDPEGQMVLDFLQQQGSYFVVGSGSDGGKVRLTLGLQTDPGN